MGEIQSTIEAGVLFLRLENGRSNAITSPMGQSLADTLSALPEEVGAVVVAGTRGGTFCAGSDIRELVALQQDEGTPQRLLRCEASALQLLADLPVPTIAAVDGIAFGGGMELASACDLVFAGPGARFCLPEIRLGVFPALGGTVWIPRRMGYARALEMMLSGTEIDAETAHRWNFVNRLTEGSAEDPAAEVARALAGGPREAARIVKQSLKEGCAGMSAALQSALESAIRLAASPESREGLRAFSERRAPDFAAARRGAGDRDS